MQDGEGVAFGQGARLWEGRSPRPGAASTAGAEEARGPRMLAGASRSTVRRHTRRQQKGLLFVLFAFLRNSGFVDVTTEDASAWYCREARREYELMRGEGRPRAVEQIGEAQTAHMIEDWRSLVVVCEKGELRQGYTRGYTPR